MSDLVRGLGGQAPGPPPAGERPAARPRPPATPAPPPPRRPAAPEPAAPVVPSEPPEPLVAELQGLLEEVRELAQSGGAFPWPRLEALIDRVVVSLSGSAELFWVANNVSAAPAGLDYLAFHQARVGVLAVRLGVTLGYEHSRLTSLGMAGCLIDVGLWQLPDAILRHLDSLRGDEATAYRAHPQLSADLVRRWHPPADRIASAVLEHHELDNGQGFPQGLRGPAIDADAKILGLVDTYTGLTAPLSARPRLKPHEAIREIVKTRQDAFPPQIIKALLSEISVFPPGTIVRLNTEEIGRVIAVNRNHPLRPRVEIIADGKGTRLAGDKIIDLSEAPFLYITGPVTEGGR